MGVYYEKTGESHEQGADHHTAEVRRRLGVRAGDRVVFEERKDGMRISAVREESRFEKY
jgi:hypothetical protein